MLSAPFVGKCCPWLRPGQSPSTAAAEHVASRSRRARQCRCHHRHRPDQNRSPHQCRSGCLHHRRRRLTRQRRISGSSPHHHRRRRRRHRRAPVLLRRALAIPQGSPCHPAGQCHMQCCSPCRSAGQRDTVAIRCRGVPARMGRSCRGQLSCRLSIQRPRGSMAQRRETFVARRCRARPDAREAPREAATETGLAICEFRAWPLPHRRANFKATAVV